MEEKLQEKAVLVGLNITTNVKKIDDIDINESMEELKELVKAAGAEVLASVIQNKPARDAAYFIGKGKVEEIRDYCHMLGATMIVFNDELSGAHMRNIINGIIGLATNKAFWSIGAAVLAMFLFKKFKD